MVAPSVAQVMVTVPPLTEIEGFSHLGRLYVLTNVGNGSADALAMALITVMSSVSVILTGVVPVSVYNDVVGVLPSVV